VLKGLPPLGEVLRGSFLEREIRCGKPRCRCRKGPGHALLCVTVSVPGGRTPQVTVPPELAATIKIWIENYRRNWQAIEEVSAINRKLLKLRQIPYRQSLPKPQGGSEEVKRAATMRIVTTVQRLRSRIRIAPSPEAPTSGVSPGPKRRKTAKAPRVSAVPPPRVQLWRNGHPPWPSSTRTFWNASAHRCDRPCKTK